MFASAPHHAWRRSHRGWSRAARILTRLRRRRGGRCLPRRRLALRWRARRPRIRSRRAGRRWRRCWIAANGFCVANLLASGLWPHRPQAIPQKRDQHDCRDNRHSRSRRLRRLLGRTSFAHRRQERRALTAGLEVPIDSRGVAVKQCFVEIGDKQSRFPAHATLSVRRGVFRDHSGKLSPGYPKPVRRPVPGARSPRHPTCSRDIQVAWRPAS